MAFLFKIFKKLIKNIVFPLYLFEDLWYHKGWKKINN